MPTNIHPDLKIYEIIQRFPQTRAVFVANGLGTLVSDDAMRVLAPFLTLGTALKSRFINIEAFIKMLEGAIAKEPVIDSPGLASMEAQKDLSFLGLMPCGLKMPFSRAFSQFLNELQTQEGFAIQSAVEGNVNQELSYYSYVDTIESKEELPDIIVSADFNVFLGHRFYNSFVAPGHFTGYGELTAGPNFSDTQILDPKNEYTILCVNPLVVIANLDKLETRELPRTWEDMLAPEWKKSLIIRGGDGFYCHAVLLPTFKEHGKKGLEALANNVLEGLHPAQMVNRIDSNGPGALYVMPAFFADRIRHQDRIKVIWPDDGALASPVILQVKPEKKEELKPVLDYLVGRQLAQILAGAGFPVPHADVAAEVQSKPLKWLGWDFLRQNDLPTLNIEIDKIFTPLAP
ncbi:ABC transporter substrate-binding protein [uncultured Desulfobacter sp.]|uniref:ABC transporter substrate-binding protein n=1 Tax=uncultured Desulfobacter sp. TaxID=240139 RepID=UPI0029F46FB9|nr:ABC transporter substrate-binding protein [uncultured Desulfobacter sp.]